MNMDTKICNAFQSITPNILDGILKDCSSEAKTVTEFKPRKRRTFFHKLSTIAAVLALIIVSAAIGVLIASGGTQQQAGNDILPPKFEEFTDALAHPFEEALEMLHLSQSDISYDSFYSKVTGKEVYDTKNKVSFAGFDFDVELRRMITDEEKYTPRLYAFAYNTVLEEDPKAASERIHSVIAKLNESYGITMSPPVGLINVIRIAEITAPELEEYLTKMLASENVMNILSATWRVDVLDTEAVNEYAAFQKEVAQSYISKYLWSDKMFLTVSANIRTFGPGNGIHFELEYSLEPIKYNFRSPMTTPGYDWFKDVLCYPKEAVMKELGLFEYNLIPLDVPGHYETTQNSYVYADTFNLHLAFADIHGIERLIESSYVGSLEGASDVAELISLVASEMTEKYGGAVLPIGAENRFWFADLSASDLEAFMKSSDAPITNTWNLGTLTGEDANAYMAYAAEQSSGKLDPNAPLSLMLHITVEYDAQTDKATVTLRYAPEVFEGNYAEKAEEAEDSSGYLAGYAEQTALLGYPKDVAASLLNLSETEIENWEPKGNCNVIREEKIRFCGNEFDVELTMDNRDHRFTEFGYITVLADVKEAAQSIKKIAERLKQSHGQILMADSNAADPVDFAECSVSELEQLLTEMLNKNRYAANIWRIKSFSTTYVKEIAEDGKKYISKRIDPNKMNFDLSMEVSTDPYKDGIQIKLTYSLDYIFTMPQNTNPVADEQTQMLLQAEFDRIESGLVFGGIGKFQSVEELTAEDAFYFIFECIENPEQYERMTGDDTAWMIPVSVLDDLSEELFGRTFDYSAVKDLKIETRTASFKKEKGKDYIYVLQEGGFGSETPFKPTGFYKLDDNQYQMIISWYGIETSKKPTESNADWFSSYPGTYYIADEWTEIIWQYVDDHFQIVSNSEY